MANAEDSLPSDSTETTSAPSLPLELTAAIIEEVIAIHLDAAEWTEAAELCLLSKSLLPFAQGALYRTLYLVESHRGADPTVADIEDLGSEEAHRRASDNTELLDTLQAAPHLARLVVNIIIRPSGHRRKRKTVQWEASTALRVCENASGISARASCWVYWPAIAKALAMDDNAGRLRNLSVATFDLSDGGDIYALHDASRLRHLSVTQFNDHREEADILPLTPTFHLTSFRVALASRVADLPRTLHSFLATSTHSLQRLDIPRSFVSLDLFSFLNLKDFTISDPLHIFPRASPDAILQAVATVPSLAILRLAWPPQPVSPYGSPTEPYFAIECDKARFLEHLPDHVQVVDVRTIPFRLASLIVFLDRASSPSLRRLDAMRFDDEVERRALQLTCWNRGVELYTFPQEGKEEEETEYSMSDSDSEGED